MRRALLGLGCAIVVGCAGTRTPATPAPTPQATPDTIDVDAEPRAGHPLRKLPRGAAVLWVELDVGRGPTRFEGHITRVVSSEDLTPTAVLDIQKAEAARGPSSTRVQTVDASGHVTDYYLDVVTVYAEAGPAESVRIFTPDFRDALGEVAVVTTQETKEIRLLVGDTVLVTHALR